MPKLISYSTRKARKIHKCGLCNNDIATGELYRRHFLKYEGQVYSFKEHDICGEIASCLWNFIDPNEGMTEEDFQEGCQEYCSRFVCPLCVHWIDDECEDGQVYCLNKIADRLKEYGIKEEPDKYGMPRWVEVKRKDQGGGELNGA